MIEHIRSPRVILGSKRIRASPGELVWWDGFYHRPASEFPLMDDEHFARRFRGFIVDVDLIDKCDPESLYEIEVAFADYECGQPLGPDPSLGMLSSVMLAAYPKALAIAVAAETKTNARLLRVSFLPHS